MTVPLESFIGSMHYITVFKCNSVAQLSDLFSHLNRSI